MANKRVPPEVTEFFRAIGKKYGASGGKAAAANMTDKEKQARAKKACEEARVAHMKLTHAERSARARQAATARWAQEKEQEK